MDIYYQENLAALLAAEAEEMLSPDYDEEFLQERWRLLCVIQGRLKLFKTLENVALFSICSVIRGVLMEWLTDKCLDSYFSRYRILMSRQNIFLRKWLSREGFAASKGVAGSPYDRYRELEERQLRVGDSIVIIRPQIGTEVCRIKKISPDCYLVLEGGRKISPFDAERWQEELTG